MFGDGNEAAAAPRFERDLIDIQTDIIDLQNEAAKAGFAMLAHFLRMAVHEAQIQIDAADRCGTL